MPSLQRHQLVRLSPAGWQQVLAGPWGASARAALAHWARTGLPLVVGRQREAGAGDPAPAPRLQLGLPTPLTYGRERLRIEVALEAVLFYDEFPAASAALRSVPMAARTAWARLVRSLEGQGVRARVFGSHGWQQLSGLRYVHERSDLDLLLPVSDLAQADAVCAALMAAEAGIGAASAPAPASAAGPRPPPASLRIDGELVFPDGAAVAWREWAPWRVTPARGILVKRIDGVALAHDAGWLARSGAWPLEVAA